MKDFRKITNNGYLENLVSIIVPCYNGGKYLERFFNSILAQTYKKIQLIFINDGSQDLSENIALIYKNKFESENMEFIYLYQSNCGQAAAINTGIPYIRGEYLMWIDCDDYLEINHVKKKVDFLKDNSQYDVVMCKGNIFSENDLDNVIGILGNEKAVGSIFEDVLFTYRACSCGLYMVRTHALFHAIPHKKILESEAGQNMQLLLPILAYDRVGYLNERLYNYVLYKYSHSHVMQGGVEWKKRYDVLEDMKRKVLEDIPLNADYRKRLLESLKMQIVAERMSALDAMIERQRPEYVNLICQEYFNISGIAENIKGRKCFIWGMGKRAEKIKIYFSRYAGVEIKGFIDSSFQRQKDNTESMPVFSPNEIQKENMFILIPLAKYYPEIVDRLHNEGFWDKRDFFYPAYEIQKAVKERKNEDIF